MFKLLTECLTEEQQNKLIAQSLVRGTKGLEASDAFYALPIDSILTAAKATVMNLQNSYAVKRSGIPGTTIWCDRFAELAIFFKSLVNDDQLIELALLQRYPIITKSELQYQSGGLAYGYWKLAGLLENHSGIDEEALDGLINVMRELIPKSTPQSQPQPQPQPQPLTFAQELAGYTNAKNGRNRQPQCALTGGKATAIRSSAMPYKTQIYGNRRALDSRDLVTFVSSEWQRELALRLVLFGKDKDQQKWWVYANRNIKNINGIEVPMDYVHQHQAIAKVVELMAEEPSPVSKIGDQHLKLADRLKVLVTPSVMPEDIEDDYCIQVPPFWMQILNCKSSGDVGDARQLKRVRQVLQVLHHANSNKHDTELSFNRHAAAVATDLLHIPDMLRSVGENVNSINWCFEVIQGLQTQKLFAHQQPPD